MRIHVFDVGHGDSIVLEFPDGVSHAIIDCNRWKSGQKGKKGGDIRALAYFQDLAAKGVNPIIEFACLTHPHHDHYNGFADLLEGVLKLNIPIKEFWDFGAASVKAEAMSNLAYHKLQIEQMTEYEQLCKLKLKLREQYECRYKIPIADGSSIWSGQNVSIEALAPDPSLLESYWNYLALGSDARRREYLRVFPYSGNDNIVCSALLIKFGSGRFILGGDLTNEAWRRVLKSRGQLPKTKIICHAIKVSHHGSLDGNFPEAETPLVQYLQDSEVIMTAVISGGYRTHLPHPKTLSSLSKSNCNLYCTGRPKNGTPSVYRPPGIEDTEALALMEADEIEEVTDSTEPGHGNIIVECSSDGSCKVSPQYDFAIGRFE